MRSRLRARVRGGPPPPGAVRFGSLRRLTPVSRQFGFDRGTPVDRRYIEDFLKRYSGSENYGRGDIRGQVMEVGGDLYSHRLGRQWVESVDILHANADNPEATLVGDLVSGEGIPTGRYDCIVCTQTLHLLYDVRAVVATLERALRPGGVVLATVSGISQACRPDRELWGDHWRFTAQSARRVFEESFPAENVSVEAYGNVLAATAFLYGIAAEELRPDELESRDPDYELLIGIRAMKPAG